MRSSLRTFEHFALALAVAGATASTQTLEHKPNVLIIVGDDLGYGELSSQDFTQQGPTPHIDSIATHGVRFTSGYVTGPFVAQPAPAC